jgi:hypothetical protein
MSVIECVLGVALVLIVLFDAFETIVLPRTVARRFRLTRLIVRATWGPWSLISRLPIGTGNRDWFIAIYGPLLLLLLLGTWAIGLVCGFGLMIHGLSRGVTNAPSLGDAMSSAVRRSSRWVSATSHL